jgi:pimeloyl-ACP methyl ester carboxylesterase
MTSIAAAPAVRLSTRIGRFAQRMLLGLLIAIVALAVLGATWEWFAERHDRVSIPREGRLVDVGGRRVHVLEMGGAQPGPTVILESGIGGASTAVWGWIEPGISEFAHVVAYDRAGIGRSEPSLAPRDGRTLVAELHETLAAAGVPGPYVFVGHSYGGLLARLYTNTYPNDVAGLVLCEPSHPNMFGTTPAARRRLGRIASALPIAPFLARLGAMRAFLAFEPTDIDKLPPPARDEQRAFMASSRPWPAIVSELAMWDSTNAETRGLGGFGDRPLIVLTAARRPGRWARLQAETSQLSTDAVHRTIPGAGHATLIQDQRYAKEVVAAVREVVQAVRGGTALAKE